MSRNTKVSWLFSLMLLGGCQSLPDKTTATMPAIQQALEESTGSTPPPAVEPPPEVQRALLPPASSSLAFVKPEVPTFDVSVNEAPAEQFFMSLVDGTSQNMVVHPEVTGNITLNLTGVTTEEVLATMRDVYGYEYRYSHGVYQVFPARMRSQVFKVNYLDLERKGGSRTRVSSGQVSQAGGSGDGGTSQGNSGNTSGTNGNTNNGSSQNGFSGAQVTTRTLTDFWSKLEDSLKTMIGEEGGRRIITDPLSGTVMVRATPRELMDVEH